MVNVTDWQVVIPHRVRRDIDWQRQANLDSAVRWWRDNGVEPLVVDDGRTGDDHFNRSAAYNKGIAATTAEVIVFSEADLLVPIEQIKKGVHKALQAPGLVVPFSRFMALDEADSVAVRARTLPPEKAKAEQVRGDCQSIGAVNIVSRETIRLIGGGWDECMMGHGYDDDSMELAFRTLAGPTRFIDGPGYHQYHIPGAFFATPESTAADRAATERNKQRWRKYLRAIDDREQMLQLVTEYQRVK